jgi:endonuclease/exonuclease/phosphatase (EEP) superfamily protein YafD
MDKQTGDSDPTPRELALKGFARNRSLFFFAFLLIFCGVFFALLYANRNYHRPPPPSAVWSPPDKLIRIVSCNVQHNQRGIDKILDDLRKLEPDIVLLQEIEKTELSQMTEALHTLPAIYHASENLAGRRASWGNAILSKYPLYEGSTVPSGAGGSFGVWATAVVGNAKFKIVSVHLASVGNELSQLAQVWQEAGARPIIVGGVFNQGPMTHPWTAAGTTFLISKEWKSIETGGAEGEPVWLVAGKN